MNYQSLLGFVILLLFGCETVDKTPKTKEQIVYHSEIPGFRIDPIEVDPAYREIFLKIDGEVDDALEDHPRHFGFIHVYWAMKKEILLKKYGVDWRSPQEMHPHVSFD